MLQYLYGRDLLTGRVEEFLEVDKVTADIATDDIEGYVRESLKKMEKIVAEEERWWWEEGGDENSKWEEEEAIKE